MSTASPDPAPRRSPPKYVVVRDAIAARIRGGELGDGDQLEPVKELMRRHGVSFATMTRALVELERAGLIVRRWGHGTFVRAPRPAARNVAVTFDSRYSIIHPQRVSLCRGLTDAAEAHGAHLQMFPLRQSTIFGGEDDLLLAKLLESGDIAGLIGCGIHPPSDVQRLAALGVPFVAVNHEYPGAAVSCVGTDADHAADLLADHLMRLGHRRLGLVLAVAPEPAARRIRSSQRLAMSLFDRLRREPTVRFEGHVVFSNYDWYAIEAELRRWLASEDRPTALFCIEEHLTLNTLELAASLGLRVPEDLSVVGMGDLTRRGVTSVVTPARTKGEEAMQLLSAALEGRPPTHRLFKPDLAVGQTTGPPPGVVTNRGRATTSSFQSPFSF